MSEAPIVDSLDEDIRKTLTTRERALMTWDSVSKERKAGSRENKIAIGALVDKQCNGMREKAESFMEGLEEKIEGFAV